MASFVYAPPTSSLSESPYLQPNETCSTLAVPAVSQPAGCFVWRSCRSCLQKVGCMISSGSNKCVSQIDLTYGYNSSMDYRKAFDANLTLPNATVSNPQGLQSDQAWQFRAIDAKYCAVDDATCTQCKEESFYRTNSNIDSRFCVGADGCVCVLSCEFMNSRSLSFADCDSPTFDYTTRTPTGGPDAQATKISDTAMTGVIAIPCALLLVLVVFMFRRANAQRAEFRQQEQARMIRQARSTRPRNQPRSTEIGVTALTLTGWGKHREKLVENENLRLAGFGDVDTTTYTGLSSPGNTPELPPATTTSQDQQQPTQTLL